MNKPYGEKLKDLRIAAKLTLREFAKKIGGDPGNWSKIERGLMRPPSDAATYKQLRRVLGIPDETVNELLSVAQAMKILPCQFSESELMQYMPVLLRRANGEPLSKEDADRLVKWIKKTSKSESNE